MTRPLHLRLLLAPVLLAPVLALLLAPAVAAADTFPLSTFPAKPARYGQPAGPLHSKITDSRSRFTIEPDAGACISGWVPDFWIDGDTVIEPRWYQTVTDAGYHFGIERLIDRGDSAELERIEETVSQETHALEATARSRIPLHPVAKLPGLTIYAYRWANKVFLVSRSSLAGALRTDGSNFKGSSECLLLLSQLTVRDGSSQAAQLSGTIPGSNKPYLVDASISQTSRDPEPLLSITARVLDR